MHITKMLVQYFTKHFKRLEFIHDNDFIRSRGISQTGWDMDNENYNWDSIPDSVRI